MKITVEQAWAAAEWWAEKLTSPTFDNLGPTRGNNAHETEVNTFASTLAGMNANASPVDDKSLRKFKEALVNTLLNGGLLDSSLYVDYGPDKILADAAMSAGISTSRFPWKSGTYFVAGGKVLAKCGYGAPHIQIYPKSGNGCKAS